MQTIQRAVKYKNPPDKKGYCKEVTLQKASGVVVNGVATSLDKFLQDNSYNQRLFKPKKGYSVYSSPQLGRVSIFELRRKKGVSK